MKMVVLMSLLAVGVGGCNSSVADTAAARSLCDYMSAGDYEDAEAILKLFRDAGATREEFLAAALSEGFCLPGTLVRAPTTARCLDCLRAISASVW